MLNLCKTSADFFENADHKSWFEKFLSRPDRSRFRDPSKAILPLAVSGDWHSKALPGELHMADHWN